MANSSRTAGLPVVVLLVVALTACGGDDGGAGTTLTSEAAKAETTDTASPGTVAESTTSTTGQVAETADDSSEVTGETSAVLTLGGETYAFGMGPGASCETERMGFLYEAKLHRVDQDGERVGDTDSILLVFDGEGRGTTVSVVADGENWTAGEGTGGGSPSDTYSVDCQRGEASLTFVNAAGDEAKGRLEVFCAEE